MEMPICNNCKDEARFTESGMTTTCMDYRPIYDAQGNNTNPDKNVTSWYLTCTCGKEWRGSACDGKTEYKEIDNGNVSKR